MEYEGKFTCRFCGKHVASTSQQLTDHELSCDKRPQNPVIERENYSSNIHSVKDSLKSICRWCGARVENLDSHERTCDRRPQNPVTERENYSSNIPQVKNYEKLRR